MCPSRTARPWRHPRLAPLALAALLVGCLDRHAPLEPGSAASLGEESSAGPAQQTTISDAFSFLPPIASSTFRGTFDGGQSPVVEICRLTGPDCGPVVATFTKATGSGSERLRTDGQHYIVNWHTGRFGLSPSDDYRIRVLLQDFELGHVNVDLLGRSENPSNGAPGYLTVRLGATLPIKFQLGKDVLAGRFVRVSAGVGHSCGLDVEATAWCWGNDFFGQLGYGTKAAETCGPSSYPCSTIARPVAPPLAGAEPLRFVDISAGDGHTCALQASGAVWCWGLDADGQLGDGPGAAEKCSGSYPCSMHPVRVIAPEGGATPPPFRVVDAGRYFTCAVAEGGAGYCWGFNVDGELGTDQTPGAAHRPVAIHAPTGASQPLGFRDIAAARLSACGIALDGSAWCWGRNTDGQLGNGSWSVNPSATDVPVAVVPPLGQVAPLIFTNVGVWDPFTCARAPDGTAWCWGANAGGPDSCLNPCTTRPVQLPGAISFKYVGAGCGLTDGGTAYCWPPAVGSPAAVTGHVFTQLDKGAHACAVQADGSAWCWGGNKLGELGDGTTTDRATPVRVVVGP